MTLGAGVVAAAPLDAGNPLGYEKEAVAYIRENAEWSRGIHLEYRMYDRQTQCFVILKL